MPNNHSYNKVLVIGAGPIIIGQGCEFDYAGTQACKALKEEGCYVVLVNSNPATIMTDPGVAHATYVEPITSSILQDIIDKERPDAILPTMGGQTALNATLELADSGVLDRYGIKVLGPSLETIRRAEHRQLFSELLHRHGLPALPSFLLTCLDQLPDVEQTIGLPVMVRSSFTLGGHGSGIATTAADLQRICREQLKQTSSGLLIEPAISGWKEIELELIVDQSDSAIVVCGIENIDPMGVHTGDSITVAPIQTLTDNEYQAIRTTAFAVVKALGMRGGGCNVQFAINPTTGTVACIEVNPRVSRSSALASKATGFPIATISTKLALGYRLHEIRNDRISFPASFEPALDYIVVKIPYFNFEKFATAPCHLASSMKAVGEAMAIGRTFQEALHKAIDSLDGRPCGLQSLSSPSLHTALAEPHPMRLWYIAEAFRHNWTVEQIHSLTHYDPWFLTEIETLVRTEQEIAYIGLQQKNEPTGCPLIQESHWRAWKQAGFSDARLATLLHVSEEQIWQLRHEMGITPTYKRIDTCAAEFVTSSSYLYSSFEEECEAHPTSRPKVLVLGSGPNRIGQGIEFDYCCVHAVEALKGLGYETIMVNCNPSTVSTDHDISDRLYLEPLTVERIHEIAVVERPVGLLIQCGGQTPLNAGRHLSKRGLPILGTQFPSIDCCEDREQFRHLIAECGLTQPRNATATTPQQAHEEASAIGYPIVVRPSYVIGGASIDFIPDVAALNAYCVSHPNVFMAPVLVEQWLAHGIEAEVDAIADGSDVYICGVIEHLDPVGIHSGDSICALSPVTLSPPIQETLKQHTRQLALALGIKGFINVQFCIQGEKVYILEANPRASRTIPLLSKVASIPFVSIATRCMAGSSLQSQGYWGEAAHRFSGLKVPVFPFQQMGVAEKNLGPRMVSTGETLSIGKTFREAFSKAVISIDRSLLLSPRIKKEMSQIDVYSTYRL
jgi:carbamoyl-phosphate synthase large subunit